MSELKQLSQKIQTYKVLKDQRDMLDTRLDELNKSIKREILDNFDSNLEGPVVWHTPEGYIAKLTPKRSTPKVDTGALEQLLDDKGLWLMATRRQVDHSLVEQLFIEGKLTDDDLRSINQGSSITLALSVTREESDDLSIKA